MRQARFRELLERLRLAYRDGGGRGDQLDGILVEAHRSCTALEWETVCLEIEREIARERREAQAQAHSARRTAHSGEADGPNAGAVRSELCAVRSQSEPDPTGAVRSELCAVRGEAPAVRSPCPGGYEERPAERSARAESPPVGSYPGVSLSPPARD